MKKRVVITGCGAVSALGLGIDPIWEACLAGRTGIKTVTRLDLSAYKTKIGAEVPDFPELDAVGDPKLMKRADRFAKFALYASLAALEDTGLEITDDCADDVGVIVSSGIGGMMVWEEQHQRLLERGPDRTSPFLIPMMIADMASGIVSMECGARGPNMGIVTACASGSHSIGESAQMIRSGRAKVMVAGGTESSIAQTAYSGFCAAGALSECNDTPEQACKPFDRKHDGFVIGEGATVLVLEEYEFARSRGANIIGELAGYAATGDAHHITAPDPDGKGAVLAMRRALADAEIESGDIAYINAHAPGTPAGDDAEASAIGKVFAHGADGPLVSSTKSIHGHMLGATGACELALALRMLNEGVVPATLNLDDPIDDMVNDVVMGEHREFSGEYAMSNSFGFGGHNAVLVLKRFS